MILFASTWGASLLSVRASAQANLAVEPASVTAGALAATPDDVPPASVPKKKRARKSTGDDPAPPTAADEHKPKRNKRSADPLEPEPDAPQPTAAAIHHHAKAPPEEDESAQPTAAATHHHAKAPPDQGDPTQPTAAVEHSKSKRHAEPLEDEPSIAADVREKDEAAGPRPKRKRKSAAQSDRDPSLTAAESDLEPPLTAADDAEEPTKKKIGSKRASSKHAKPRREREPSPDYRKLRDSWHAPVADPVEAAAIFDEQGRPPLVIVPVNGGERVTLTPDRDDGGFDDKDLSLAARVFTPGKLRNPHPVAPHLLDLVYQTMRHFAAPLVRLVSGYRQDRAGSRHTQGRAIDMVIPGVSNEELVEYVRHFGFCGVGIYPKSGFVHLDVRESSFYWVDDTLPDERSKGVPVDGDAAKTADQCARERGEGPQTFVPNNDKEDRAAAHAYARRAKHRAAAAATERAATAE